jgi:hypothetical protein
MGKYAHIPSSYTCSNYELKVCIHFLCSYLFEFGRLADKLFESNAGRTAVASETSWLRVLIIEIRLYRKGTCILADIHGMDHFCTKIAPPP